MRCLQTAAVEAYRCELLLNAGGLSLMRATSFSVFATVLSWTCLMAAAWRASST